MTGSELLTANPAVLLVPIDVERDALLGVEWLSGDSGRETLRLMGVTSQNNHESSLEAERERLTKIITDPNELAWMIQLEGQVVGILEVRTEGTKYIDSPVVSIMIGDPSARGKGVGTAALEAGISYLFEQGHTKLHARHLRENTASAHLLAHCGFRPEGELYKDDDDLEWQNVSKERPDA